jgi:hypothetical protein
MAIRNGAMVAATLCEGGDALQLTPCTKTHTHALQSSRLVDSTKSNAHSVQNGSEPCRVYTDFVYRRQETWMNFGTSQHTEIKWATL